LKVSYHFGEDAFAVEIMKAACLTPGTASLRICSHLPIRENSRLLKPVMLPVGRAQPSMPSIQTARAKALISGNKSHDSTMASESARITL